MTTLRFVSYINSQVIRVGVLGLAGAVVLHLLHRWAIWVRCPILVTRDDSGDHCTQATKERRWWWIHPGFETHGKSHQSLQQRVPGALQNGPQSNKNLFKKRSGLGLFHLMECGLCIKFSKRNGGLNQAQGVVPFLASNVKLLFMAYLHWAIANAEFSFDLLHH